MVTRILPLANYPDQVTVVGPFTVPVGASSIMLSVLRCTPADPTIWPNASTLLSVQSELSVDSGASWRPFFGFTDQQGGQLPDEETGGVAATSYLATAIPQATNPSRRVRATVTVKGGPLRSACDMTLE